MLLTGSRHVNLPGPGAANAGLVRRGGGDPPSLLPPGWATRTRYLGKRWGTPGRLGAVGCCWQEGSGPVAVSLGDCG